jgi:predicted nuclease of predicted toxin-antitoxin system
MNLLLDMNLSPVWVEILLKVGYDATHWSSIGQPNDKDIVIFRWARKEGYAIVTLDLDFGTLLAQTGSKSPSVIQIRREDVSPERLEDALLNVLSAYFKEIEEGALIVVDELKIRLRMLPIG